MPYILAYKPTIFGWILRTKLWESAYMRVMPHSHTLAARVNAAWTISRPLGHHVGVEVHGGRWDHTQTAATAAAAAYQVSHSLSLDTTPTLTPCKTIVQPSHTRAVRCHAVTCTLAVVVLVNSSMLRHYQRTYLGYSFSASFHYRLIRKSLIFATFSAAGMGVGLYAGRLIREYKR